ncbi:MAG: nuclear transport factor 2 family protein [Nitrospinales bacterium]
MQNEEKAKEANERFYTAFTRRDMNLMKKVWCEDYSATCIHPGWNVLKGFDLIMDSWEKIFQNTDILEIRPVQVEVTASLDLAWVNCQEKLFSMTSTGIRHSLVYATNLFKLEKGEWKLILHHASALPGISSEVESR